MTRAPGWPIFAGGVIFTLALSACGPGQAPSVSPKADSSPPGTPAAATPDDAPSFDPQKGLYLPAAIQRAIGLTTEPAQGRAFSANEDLKFQVFREADEAPLPGMPYRLGYAYASALLSGAQLRLAPGKRGVVLIQDGSPGQQAATLFQINPLPNSNQVEFLVEIADPQHRFDLNDFCMVRWNLSTITAAAAVPNSALLKTTQGEFVYRAGDDRFVRVAVKTGASGKGFTEITEGLSAGDAIVVQPVQNLWLTELKLQSGGAP